MKKKILARQRRGNYEVGKGRPPKQSQWKPGQSGNPKGRPKGSKNYETFLTEALQQKISIQERGKTRKITALEGIARRQVNRALSGDAKAIKSILENEPKIAREVHLADKIPKDPVEAAKV